jgi:hypothetical protein
MFQGFYREPPRAQQILTLWKESGHLPKSTIFNEIDDLWPPKMAQEGSKAFDYVWEKEGCQLIVPISQRAQLDVRLNDLLTYGTASNGLRFGQDSCEKR